MVVVGYHRVLSFLPSEDRRARLALFLGQLHIDRLVLQLLHIHWYTYPYIQELWHHFQIFITQNHLLPLQFFQFFLRSNEFFCRLSVYKLCMYVEWINVSMLVVLSNIYTLIIILLYNLLASISKLLNNPVTLSYLYLGSCKPKNFFLRNGSGSI